MKMPTKILLASRATRFFLPAILLLAFLWTGPPVQADDKTPVEAAPAPAWVGIHVRAITAIDDNARTFDADLDLWMHYTGGKDLPSFVLPDVVKPVTFSAPVQQREQDRDHYRLCRAQATLRYRVTAHDLVRGQRTLGIRLSTDGNSSGAELASPAPAAVSGQDARAFSEQLGDDDVLAGLDGWTLLDGSLVPVKVKMPVVGALVAEEMAIDKATQAAKIQPPVALLFSTA